MEKLERKNKFIEKEKTLPQQEKSAVKKIAKKEKENKMISASVNAENYAAFTRINKAKGMSNNSCLNMLIADYVAKHNE